MAKLFKDDGTPAAKRRKGENELEISVSKLLDDFEVVSEDVSTVVQVTGGTAIGLLKRTNPRSCR